MNNRKAIFIVGFNNWGKTNLIYSLFERKQFSTQNPHQIFRINNSPLFMAMSASNDDWGTNKYKEEIEKRTKNNKIDFFGTLCPGIHQYNHFINILNSTELSVFDEFHLLLIEHKYDNMAKLIIKHIEGEISQSPIANKIHSHVISVTDVVSFPNPINQNKMNQIVSVLNTIYP